MYPQYLIEYPNMNTSFPFYIKRKQHTLVPPHRHDFIELTLIMDGKGKEFINGLEHPMTPGTMVLLLPYQVHQIEADPSSPLDMYICNFDMKLLTEGSEPEQVLWDLIYGGNSQQLSFVQINEALLGDIQSIFAKMLQEYQSDDYGKHVIIKAKLLETLTYYARSMRSTQNKPNLFASSSPVRTKPIWQIIRYIHEHYLESVTLSVLSEQFHLHPTYISELFSEYYGVHFLEFLQELRIRHACSLLLSSDMPLSEIAMESGFDAYSTFNRTFRKLKGISPRVYRSKERFNE
jgi:AraC-like DNA-binding protein